jgi:hypothetical protein
MHSERQKKIVLLGLSEELQYVGEGKKMLENEKY